MSAKSLTVLDWNDIRVLTELCTRTSAEMDEHEAARHNLVEALREFLEIWRPGQMMQNDLRQRLVAALDSFICTSPESSHEECQVLKDGESIKQRLIGAIEAAERSAQLHSKPADGTLMLLLMLALEKYTQFFGHWQL